MTSYSLLINNETHQVEAAPDTPVLWVLRDTLKLKGTKFGCGIGLCGSCTIHVNGKAVRSCSLPVSEIGNGEILTIEGLSEDGDHPVQVAWFEENVPQCGYCQPGQIMSVVALLKENANPTDKEIDEFMSGHICRCGTYPRIKKAIYRAGEEGGLL